MVYKRLTRPCCVLLGAASYFVLSSTVYGQTLTGTGPDGNELTGLGDLAGGAVSSTATGISPDGLVVVGNSQSVNGIEAFRWTSGGGMVGLGDLPGGAFASSAYDASDDGSVIVGESVSASGNEAFRWTSGGGMVGLGDLAGGAFVSIARAVNSDGSVIVGEGRSAGGQEAFRWTQGGGMVGLGELAGGIFFSNATGVSADGSVVAGTSNSANGYEAFRWTQAGGMVGLGDLAGGVFSSAANDISADGTVIVGQGTSAGGTEAFRWTQGGGMVALGDLPGGAINSVARAVNTDGSVIVGQGTTGTGSAAFRWLSGAGAGSGLQSVASLLTGDGVTLGAWVLTDAIGVSGNGRIIAGTGTNPSGNTEAWIAVVNTGLVSPPSPAPSSPPATPSAPASAPVVPGAPEGTSVFVTVADFAGSLGAVGSAASSLQVSTQKNLSGLLNVGRHFNLSRGPRPKGARIAWNSLAQASEGGAASVFGRRDGEVSVWGVGAAQFHNFDGGQSDNLVGAFGLAQRVTPETRLGLGGTIGEAELELNGASGVSGGGGNESDRSTVGVSSFAAFEPSYLPLRLYAGVSATWIDEDVTRGYLNGVTPVRGQGQRDGTAYGAVLRAGWEVGLDDTTSIMPFAGYEVSKLKLDRYAETTGPLPAVFDAVDETTHVSRLGGEVTTWVSQNTALWGSLAWAHQFDGAPLTVTGSVPVLNADFAFASGAVARNAGEFEMGLNAKVSERIDFSASFDATSDFDDNPRFGTTIGFNIRL